MMAVDMRVAAAERWGWAGEDGTGHQAKPDVVSLFKLAVNKVWASG